MRQISSWCVAVCSVVLATQGLPAADWPQWGGTAAKNMISAEQNLPVSFEPGQQECEGRRHRDGHDQKCEMGARIGDFSCGTPSVAHGKVYLAGMNDSQGVLKCFEEATGNSSGNGPGRAARTSRPMP